MVVGQLDPQEACEYLEKLESELALHTSPFATFVTFTADANAVYVTSANRETANQFRVWARGVLGLPINRSRAKRYQKCPRCCGTGVVKV